MKFPQFLGSEDERLWLQQHHPNQDSNLGVLRFKWLMLGS